MHSLRIMAHVNVKGTETMTDSRTLTKAEMADLLFERVGLNKREAKDIVDTFFEEIRDALANGDAVKLSGFGNFQVRKKPARPGRNPKTGASVYVNTRKVPFFKVGKELKERVNKGSSSTPTTSGGGQSAA